MPSRPAAALASVALSVLTALLVFVPEPAAAQRGVDIPNGAILAETIAPAPDGSGRSARLTVEDTHFGPMLRFRPVAASADELAAVRADLEGTRARLLQIIDAAEAIREVVAPPEFADLDSVRSRQLIEGLTLEELSVIKQALDSVHDWEAAIDELQAVADEIGAPDGSVLVSPPVDPVVVDAVAGAVPMFHPLATIPAPTFPTPFPANRDFVPTQDQMMAGFPPSYPDRACPASPMDRLTAARFTLSKVLHVVNGIEPTIDLLCNLNIDILGFGAKIGCIPGAVFGAAREVLKLVLSILDFCAGNVDGAEIEATWQNTRRIMARLNDHNDDMLTRFQRNQIFLQDLEGDVARKAIEQNLGSTDDDPIGLFLLPPSTCRDHQGPANDHYYPDTVGPRSQCGLIEEIDRVVAELRTLVAESGLTTNNADAEIAAAKAHLAVGEYKSAYARYRKAFRELASTHTVP